MAASGRDFRVTSATRFYLLYGSLGKGKNKKAMEQRLFHGRGYDYFRLALRASTASGAMPLAVR